MNLYVWAAIGVVLVISLRQIDFGPMKKHESRAINKGEVSNPENKETVDVESHLPTSKINKVSDLILPIGILFIATLVIIYFTGLGAVEGEKTLMNIFGEADVNFALFCGGIIGLITTFILYSRHVSRNQLTTKHFKPGIIEGATSMLPAYAILIFAWAITLLIDELRTGTYLAVTVESSNVTLSLLPVIVFI